MEVVLIHKNATIEANGTADSMSEIFQGSIYKESPLEQKGKICPIISCQVSANPHSFLLPCTHIRSDNLVQNRGQMFVMLQPLLAWVLQEKQGRCSSVFSLLLNDSYFFSPCILKARQHFSVYPADLRANPQVV